MSLINEMLSDLQKTNQDSFTLDGITSPENRSSSFKYYWLLILPIMLFILINYKSILFFNLTTDKTENIHIITHSTSKSIAIKEPLSRAVIKKERPTLLEITTTNKTNNVVINDEIKDDINITVQKPAAENKKSKTINKKKNTSIIKSTSKISIAEKQLSQILNHWQDHTADKQELYQLLIDNKRYPSIWLNALSFFRSKNNTYYLTLLNYSLDHFPNNAEFLLLISQYYFEGSQYLQANKQLEKINHKDRGPRIFQLMGLAAQKLNQHNKAIDSYKKILSLSSGRGDIHMAIAISYEALKSRDSAIFHLLNANKDRSLNPIQKKFIKQRLIAYQE